MKDLIFSGAFLAAFIVALGNFIFLAQHFLLWKDSARFMKNEQRYNNALYELHKATYHGHKQMLIVFSINFLNSIGLMIFVWKFL